MSQINQHICARGELDSRNRQTALILGGLAAAAVVGQIVFKPKWRRSEVLGIMVVPVLRTAFEEFQMRKRTRLPLDGHDSIVRAYESAYQHSGLKNKPELVLLDAEGVNAMATGTLGPARVLVLGGVDKKLDEQEMEAVFAHELGHIANKDPWLLCAVSIASSAAQKTLIQPLLERLSKRNRIAGVVAGYLVQGVALKFLLEYMRNREAAADAHAAVTTGAPHNLARALISLGATQPRARKGWRRFIPDTHPNARKRVDTLNRMSA